MKYQVMPPLTAEEYQRLYEDIAIHGILVPIEYDEEENILDGHNRAKICNELGITDFPRVVRIGMTEEQKKEHALNLNVNRRHLTHDNLRELIKKELVQNPEQSNRKIASILGVSDKTVGAQRKELELGAEIPQVEILTGADGKKYKRPLGLYNPSETDVRETRRALEEAIPEVAEAIETGVIKPKDIDSVRKHTPDQQKIIVERLINGEARTVNQAIGQARESSNDTQDRAIRRLKGLFAGMPLDCFESHTEVFEYLQKYGGNEFFNMDNLELVKDAAEWLGKFLIEFEEKTNKQNQIRRIK